MRPPATRCVSCTRSEDVMKGEESVTRTLRRSAAMLSRAPGTMEALVVFLRAMLAWGYLNHNSVVGELNRSQRECVSV
ncbi:hypothetical protein NDU88_000531 [Pleurodeles waltl]|uniref:Uncharacterized protein n=1 Tax=Pleurodeles waltl TaxID=8319 RepID=A0AAV7SX98_PLEWA|nr:hypothetical protein NDU88_000531 [Pleurodeles waltl]